MSKEGIVVSKNYIRKDPLQLDLLAFQLHSDEESEEEPVQPEPPSKGTSKHFFNFYHLVYSCG